MLTITINVNRVLFVVLSLMSILIMGFAGTLLIVVTESQLGFLWAAIATTFLLGGIVVLVFELKKDFWT